MMTMIGTYATQAATRLLTRKLRRTINRISFGRLLTIISFMTIGALFGGYITTHYGPHLWISFRPMYLASLVMPLLGSLGH